MEPRKVTSALAKAKETLTRKTTMIGDSNLKVNAQCWVNLVSQVDTCIYLDTTFYATNL